MDLTKLYGVDKEAAENGKWMTTAEGLKVKIAKHGNRLYRAELARLQKDNISALRRATAEDDIAIDLTCEAMAKHMLMDWEAEANGEVVPYTWQVGKELLLASPDFKEDIAELSVDRSNFRPEELAEKQ